MSFGNSVVAGLLNSPFHRLMSGSTDLIRYTGRRSGKQFTTPTQYAWAGEDLIILVGRPESKNWWKNFKTEGDIEVLIKREWLTMTAHTVIGNEDPYTIQPMLDAYLERYPKTARLFADETKGSPADQAVLVRCRPR